MQPKLGTPGRACRSTDWTVGAVRVRVGVFGGRGRVEKGGSERQWSACLLAEALQRLCSAAHHGDVFGARDTVKVGLQTAGHS